MIKKTSGNAQHLHAEDRDFDKSNSNWSARN
jgi:hypothetical protein